MGPLLAHFGNPADFIRERTLWNIRADLLLLKDGAAVGVEIKSRADSPKRLERQLSALNGLCLYTYVACEAAQADRYAAWLDAHPALKAGILAKGGAAVEVARAAPPSEVRVEVLMTLMLAAERRRFLLEQSGIRSKPHFREWTEMRSVFSGYPQEVLQAAAAATLARAIGDRRRFRP